MPPSFHRLAMEAELPVGDWNAVVTIYSPVQTNAQMATILIMANQNSSSPNIFTVIRFSDSSSATQPMAGSQSGMSGNQKWV